MTIADIMVMVDDYAEEVAATRDSQVPADLKRQKLVQMLAYHIGGTEPYCTVKVDGTFVHTQFHSDRPVGPVELPLYLLPQVATQAPVPQQAERLAKLEAFFAAYTEAQKSAGYAEIRRKELNEIARNV